MSELIIGVDEAGCSSIAGPVMAAAVIIEKGQKKIAGVNDSKLLTKPQRESLINDVKDKVLAYGVGAASPTEIKHVNLYWAKFKAMYRAINAIIAQGYKPDKIFVDGNKIIDTLSVEQEAVVGGDKKLWWIGAASIICKVTRDNLMADLASNIKEYSYYNFERNAGYYTPEHRDGIAEHGFCDLHRQGFDFSKFCIFLHEKFIESGMTSLDDFYKLEYGEKVDLKDKWSIYRIWKENRKNKAEDFGWK